MESLFYKSPPCLFEHVKAASADPAPYKAALHQIIERGTIKSLPSTTRSRVLVIVHIVGEHAEAKRILAHCDTGDVSKAVAILDLPRRIRQSQSKIASIERQCPHLTLDCDEDITKCKHMARVEGGPRKRRRKVDLHRRLLKSLQSQRCDQRCSYASCAETHTDSSIKEIIESASVSGAFAKQIRAWARTQAPDLLEFVLLSMPLETWKKIADVVHFHPKDFSVPYFLSTVHGSPLPEDSFVFSMKRLEAAPAGKLGPMFKVMTKNFPQVYRSFNYLRLNSHIMSDEAIAQDLARHIPLDSAIWYLEELCRYANCRGILRERLASENWQSENSKVFGSYGKLMERVLTFRKLGWKKLANALLPAATLRLSALKEAWIDEMDGLTVVFGDASASMTTAIEGASIFAPIILTVWGGELSFFDGAPMPSPHLTPTTVEQTLEVCQRIHARGCTSLASALWPYFERCSVINRIVMVTDEEENTQFQGFMFAELLRKYMDEVNPEVTLSIICVGGGDSQFQQSLQDNGISCRPLFIDKYQPDLSKFDGLLGSLFSPSCLGECTATVSSASSNSAMGSDSDEEFVKI